MKFGEIEFSREGSKYEKYEYMSDNSNKWYSIRYNINLERNTARSYVVFACFGIDESHVPQNLSHLKRLVHLQCAIEHLLKRLLTTELEL